MKTEMYVITLLSMLMVGLVIGLTVSSTNGENVQPIRSQFEHPARTKRTKPPKVECSCAILIQAKPSHQSRIE